VKYVIAAAGVPFKGHFNLLETILFDRGHTILYMNVVHCNCIFILHRFRYTTDYWLCLRYFIPLDFLYI